MHPVLQDRWRLASYLALTLPLAAAATAALTRGPQALPPAPAIVLAMLLALAALLLLFPVWYVCRAFPFDATTRSRLAMVHTVGALWTGAAGVYAGAGAAQMLASSWPAAALPASHAERSVGIFWAGGLLYLLAVALYYMHIATESAQRAERAAIEQAIQARESELRALKAQVHPHFLFNSLNSISALTSSDPAQAREMCILLAEFFRKSLAIGERPSVPLDEELALARTYLAIEGLRLGSRLVVEERVDEASRACRLPPLLLQPLVENAVRHGVATCVDGGVLRLEARAEGARLRVRVENPFDPDAPTRAGVGLGLSNVRRRLAACYGDRAVMDAERSGGRFQVTLLMPAEVEA